MESYLGKTLTAVSIPEPVENLLEKAYLCDVQYIHKGSAVSLLTSRLVNTFRVAPGHMACCLAASGRRWLIQAPFDPHYFPPQTKDRNFYRALFSQQMC